MKTPLVTLFLTAALQSGAYTADNAAPIALHPADSVVIYSGSDSKPDKLILEAGVALTEGKGQWHVTLHDDSTKRLTIQVETVDRNFGDFDHDRVLAITAIAPDGSEEGRVETVSDIGDGRDAEFLRIEANGDSMILSVGPHYPERIMRLRFDGFPDRASITAVRKPAVIVRRTITVERDRSTQPIPDPGEIIAAAETCGDPHAGIWKYLDEETDRRYSRRGGDYTLAVIPDDGGYRLVYIGGAVVMSDRWRPGMTKGRLTPSPLPGNYDLQWIGADFKEDFESANAFFEGDVLTLVFPVDRARMRFVRLR